MFQKNSWIILFETISSLCLILAFLVGLFGWRLSKGPIALSVDVFERMLAHTFHAHVRLKRTELTWRQHDGGKFLEFKVDDLLIKAKDTSIAAPKLYFQLSFSALLSGYLLPSRLSIPYVAVDMQMTGQGENEKTKKLMEWAQSIPIVGQTLLLQHLARVRDGSSRDAPYFIPSWKYVSLINIADVAVTMNHALYGRGHMSFHRLSSSSFMLEASVESQKTMPIALSVYTRRWKDAYLANVQLTATTLTHKKHEERIWNVPTQIQLLVQMNRDGVPQQANVRIHSTQAGTLRLPQGPIIHLKNFSLTGLWRATQRLFHLQHLDYTAENAQGRWQGSVLYDPQGTRFRMNLTGSDVRLKLPAFFEKEIFAQEFAIQSALDLNQDTFIISSFKGKQPFIRGLEPVQEARIEGKAQVDNLLFPNAKTPLRVRVNAQGWDLPAQFLAHFWPTHPACLPSVRDWVVHHVVEGTAKKATLVLDSKQEDNMFTISIEGTDGVIHYLEPLPPLQHAQAKIMITMNDMDVVMPQAEVQPDAHVKNLHFHAVFDEHAGIPAQITFSADGSVATLGQVLYGPPLDILPSRANHFDLRQAKGSGHAEVMLKLPLIEPKPRPEHIVFELTGQTQDMSLADFYGYPLEKAHIHFSANNKQLRFEGPATVGYIPLTVTYLRSFEGSMRKVLKAHGRVRAQDMRRMGVDKTYMDGMAQMNLSFEENNTPFLLGTVNLQMTDTTLALPEMGFYKPAGVPLSMTSHIGREAGFTHVNFAFEGKGVHLNGLLKLCNGGIVEARFPKIVLPRAKPLSPQDGPDESAFFVQNGKITFHSPLLDLTQTHAFSGKGGKQDVKATETLEASGDALQAILRRYFFTLPKRVDVSFNRMIGFNHVTFSKPLLTLMQDASTHFNISFHSHIQEEGDKPSSMMASSLPQTSDLAIISFVSKNGGALLKGLNIYKHVQGGSMRIQGVWDRSKNTLNAQLLLQRFKVQRLSLIAHLLTLASVSGIENTLSGSGGIYFEEAQVPFHLTHNALTVHQARMMGSSLGLTLEGAWDRQKNTLNLQGTIVPLYGLNSFFENIPLVGWLLVGREGEGVFGLHYEVHGPLANPTIRVNPASVFAPGVLRRLFFDEENA